jgi:hypothetical protein
MAEHSKACKRKQGARDVTRVVDALRDLIPAADKAKPH